jgi:molecular chaperone GrpE
MNQLVAIFEKIGIEPIETANQTFDPSLHNAVIHIEDESLGQNVIVEEFQKGFKYKDKVIRFAMVKVAN